MAQTAKKCPNCGHVENYEAGPLTVCTNCGEVLAESWALGDAVTDIVDGASWLENFRTNNAAPPMAPPLVPAVTAADGVPGMLGPDSGSLDSLINELRGAGMITEPRTAPPPLPPFPPPQPQPIETPFPQPIETPIFMGTVSAGTNALSQAQTELQEILPPPPITTTPIPAAAEKSPEPAPKPRLTAVREKNAARPISQETPHPLRSISSETPGPKLVLIPLTSPGVQSTVHNMIQGTAGRMAKEAIDTKPILVVRGLEAADARALSERLERVGIPSKVRDVEAPQQASAPQQVTVVESKGRSWKRTAIAAGVALAVGVVLFLIAR